MDFVTKIVHKVGELEISHGEKRRKAHSFLFLKIERLRGLIWGLTHFPTCGIESWLNMKNKMLYGDKKLTLVSVFPPRCVMSCGISATPLPSAGWTHNKPAFPPYFIDLKKASTSIITSGNEIIPCPLWITLHFLSSDTCTQRMKCSWNLVCSA